MATTTNTLSTNSTVPSLGNYLMTGAIAGVISAVLNVIVLLVGQSLGVPFAIPAPGTSDLVTLDFMPVSLFSFVPALAAAVLAWALHRYVGRGKTIFLAIAIIFLLVSFIPDITMPDSVAMGTKIGLILMHIVAGGVITYMLDRKAA